MDEVFISALVSNVSVGNGAIEYSLCRAIMEAITADNDHFGQRLCYRYALNQEKPFVVAYHWKSKPAWDELKTIFGEHLHKEDDQSDEEVDAVYHSPETSVVTISSMRNAHFL
ncbi:hypothetical protein Salat_2609300 [Sesamum alatum]|uniref:Uncharacterized protein n=1 Tax=Sesamum alatum TaxID=300844 RepID=A0AAE2CAH9_9LAMI|nr:hypothetical protein Salat_2609300 [Sesamum alatum]